MENERMPREISAQIWSYLAATVVVFSYEFLGTFLLVGVINLTKGSAAGIGLSLFILLLFGGPITGAHYNPSVTIGVFINKIPDFSANLIIQFFVMILAQICGGLLSIEVFYAMLEASDSKHIADAFPKLQPKTSTWG